MLIIQVFVHVKEVYLEAFMAATTENARNSMLEPGIVRFDILQQKDEPTRFTLIEVYRDEEATRMHKKTDHYTKWRDTVGDMLAEPRYRITYESVFPADEDY